MAKKPPWKKRFNFPVYAIYEIYTPLDTCHRREFGGKTGQMGSRPNSMTNKAAYTDSHTANAMKIEPLLAYCAVCMSDVFVCPRLAYTIL